MKKIIHIKVPLDQNGHPIMSLKETSEHIKSLRNIVGEEYIVIGSILDVTILDENEKIINVEAKEYSLKEIKEILQWHSR